MRMLNVSTEMLLKQAKYCLMHNLPLLVPSNGKCPNCHTSIFADHERMTIGISKGYTTEDATTTHIKQCPHCMYIFEERGKDK